MTVWQRAFMWQPGMPGMEVIEPAAVCACDMGQLCIHQQQIGRPATLFAKLNSGASTSTNTAPICRDRLTAG